MICIQDAVGWSGSIRNEKSDNWKSINIGSPAEDDFGFQHVAAKDKEYDFGDSWEHEIVLENIIPSQANFKYPRCVASKWVYPLEDCGSAQGHERLLKIIANPENTKNTKKKQSGCS